MRQRVSALFRNRETWAPYLGRIFGVRVRLHYTWLFAFGFITAAVVTQFSTDYPFSWRVMLGIAASVLFFFAILIREFFVNFIAAQKGVVVRRVTLFALGGVREVDRETIRPSLDLLLAVAGMVLNLLIAGAFFLLYSALARTGDILVNVLVQWLAFICLMLTLLHFIPGFPLDAGRVLRALLWRFSGNYEKMTLITSWAGWGVGLIVSAAGVWILVDSQEWFGGIFLLFTGLILQNAATHSRRNLRTRNSA